MHKGHLTLVKCGQWQFEIQIKKQACYPTSLSLSLCLFPLHPSLLFTHPSIHCLSWAGCEVLEEQQAFPVCSGITVCDFSLTSQAAL